MKDLLRKNVDLIVLDAFECRTYVPNTQVERLRLENAELRKCFGDTGVNLN